METLPQVALDSVCEYLALGESCRTSLLAFASVSRACHAAARRERFSHLFINVDDARFEEKLERLECILDVTKSRNCVKVLKLGAHDARQTEREDSSPADAYTSRRGLGSDLHPIRPLRGWKPRTELRPDEFWQPLVRFISSVRLQDLVWTSIEQIPHCILLVLNKKVPICRLHVYGFDLQSLHQREPLQDIETTDYMLVTSPYLHSIVAPCSKYDASGRANYNEEAILQMAAGLAPNLKHVCVWDNSLMASGELRPRRITRPKWRGFYPESNSECGEIPKTKGQIQSLAIDAAHGVNGLQLASWDLRIDFSALRSFHLARRIDLDVLQQLAYLAERDGFSRLKVLDLPAISCGYEDLFEVELAMTRLILSLHPLIELGIVGAKGDTFEATLKRHGDELRHLRIKESILSLQQVHWLQESCPKIRELSIEILRSAGDQVEIETYRSLGSMRNLENLMLMLHCTDYSPGDGPDDPALLMMPSEDEDDQEAMAIAMHQVFINAAVDESLARSIFQQMSASHASAKAGLPPKLSEILLRVGGASVLNDQMMSSDFEGVLAWIGRSWTCTRDPRDTHQSELSIEEANLGARLSIGGRLEDDIDELSGSEQYAGIWKTLWPETGAGWKEEWQSISLANYVSNDVAPFPSERITLLLEEDRA